MGTKIKAIAARVRRRTRQMWRHASRRESLIYALVNLLLIAVGSGLSVQKGAVQGVGTSLLATGIAGLVVFAYVLLQQDTAEKLKMLGEFGLQRVFGERSVGIREEYASRARVASRHIDIMGFGLRSMREDRLNEFADWAKRCHVRILLIDPRAGTGRGSYADVRDVEEGASGQHVIQQEVEAFLAATQALRGDPGLRFEVRLYRTLPTVNIFRIDDEMFFGPYLVKQPSRNLPTFLVRDGALFNALLKHFDDVWTDPAMSVPA